MAHVHGTSGSTKYLLNGTRPINGKRMATATEIRHLHDHYQKVLADVEMTITREQDELIINLTNAESNLEKKIEEDINKRTREVDAHLEELSSKTEATESALWQLFFLLEYFGATLLRSYRINYPSTRDVVQLQTIKSDKKRRIENRLSVISNECNNVTCSYEFIKENQSFLIGAEGEEFIIGILSLLPDEYHVLNDINLHFPQAIHWKEWNTYIKNCQIDHIVVGPTGIFLIETKNWKASDIELNSAKLVYQVLRSSFGLWFYIKNYYPRNSTPKIRNIVVSMKGSPSGIMLHKHIDLLAPDQLCNYITMRERGVSETEMKKFIQIVKK